MKHEFPYKEGDVITIYDDWEKEELPIGAATLIKHISVGRSFILQEVMPERLQEVYNFETWLVQLGDKQEIRKIRYLDSVGIANSADDQEISEEQEQLSKDSFLTFNGVQIY